MNRSVRIGACGSGVAMATLSFSRLAMVRCQVMSSGVAFRFVFVRRPSSSGCIGKQGVFKTRFACYPSRQNKKHE